MPPWWIVNTEWGHRLPYWNLVCEECT